MKKPNFTSMEFPNVMMLEWIEPPKRLVIFMEESISYIRSWGKNIYKDMDDGKIESIEDLNSLVEWLYRI